MRRRALIVGNWKMNGLVETALGLADDVRLGLSEREEKKLLCEVVLCPPFTGLYVVHQRLIGSSLKLGGQNLAESVNGAFTGEISGAMLCNTGCRYVLVGHSERRTLYGETNDVVALKMAAAFRDGLSPIVCLGENLQDRALGRTLDVIESQWKALLPFLPKESNKRQQLVLAYEPVWAIGTGKVATPEQIQEVHGFIRSLIIKQWGEQDASKVRILYGGSVKPDNAVVIFSQEDVDGGLIGGASLKASDFLAIIDAYPSESWWV